MDFMKEAENLVKNVDKDEVKKIVDSALDSSVADTVIGKINDKTKSVDINKKDIKSAVDSVLK